MNLETVAIIVSVFSLVFVLGGSVAEALKIRRHGGNGYVVARTAIESLRKELDDVKRQKDDCCRDAAVAKGQIVDLQNQLDYLRRLLERKDGTNVLVQGGNAVSQVKMDVPKMPAFQKLPLGDGIDTVLVRDTLLACGGFTTDIQLRALFVDVRLRPWLVLLPAGASSLLDLVEGVVAVLAERRGSDGVPALVALCTVLAERTDGGDACRQALVDLAGALA